MPNLRSFSFEEKPRYQIDYSKLNQCGLLEKSQKEDPKRLVICTWNVNGIRTRVIKDVDNKTLNIPKQELTEFDPTVGIGRLIHESDVDVFCLQETRISEEYTKAIQVEGWEIYASESKGSSKQKRGPNSYSGTIIMYKKSKLGTPLTVLKNIPGVDEQFNEGRVVALEFDFGWLVNVYTPNSGTNRVFRNKIWNPHMLDFLSSLDNVIYCGDLNVARTIYDTSVSERKEYDDLNPEKIDEYLTEAERPGFMFDERRWLDELFERGFVDVWRSFNPKTNVRGYTYVEAFTKTKMRIDYFLVKMKRYKVTNCEIKEYVSRSSDHIPLVMTIEL